MSAATCQHCGKHVSLFSGAWFAADGSTGCQATGGLYHSARDADLARLRLERTEKAFGEAQAALRQAQAEYLRLTEGAEPIARPVIVRAEQTCAACPAQWDAWGADGTQYYLRYRHSFGSAEIRRTADGEWLDSSPERVAEFETDETDGGVISLEELCRRAGLELRLS